MVLLWILILVFLLLFGFAWRTYVDMFHWKSKFLTILTDSVLGIIIGAIVGLVLCALVIGG